MAGHWPTVVLSSHRRRASALAVFEANLRYVQALTHMTALGFSWSLRSWAEAAPAGRIECWRGAHTLGRAAPGGGGPALTRETVTKGKRSSDLRFDHIHMNTIQEKENLSMQIKTIHSGACCLVLLASATVAYAASSSNPDKQFLIVAAKTDMTEAQEGQMAEAKAWRADVKGLAKTLVQDHTESYEHLTALAAKTGVTIPKGIDTAKDPIVRQLGRLKGASFDYQFARDEAAANRMAIAAFKQEAAHGKDAEVKAYANKMIPILSKELHLAEECVRPAAHS